MKKILVITTGGTIAMKKDRETGGLMPAVSGKDLAAAVPGLVHYADLDVLEFSNKPSGWMTSADMFELSKLIDRLADTDQADGFVITHGTDTLEETAFFLEAVLKTEKPVCVTGAMRGASALSADGPANILAAVRTAASDDSIGKGVTVCLGDRIYAAWDVTKVHTTNPDTFRDLHYGSIGTVYGSRVEYGRIPVKHKKIHTDRIEENIWIITCWSGMDGGIVYGTEGKAAGLVIDGIGCGNVPPKCREAVLYLREKGMPIVLTTRVPSGSVEEEYSYEGSALSMKDSGIILGGRLSSWKARLLLALAMGKTKNIEEIRSCFLEIREE